jgi:hypothetical protein
MAHHRVNVFQAALTATPAVDHALPSQTTLLERPRYTPPSKILRQPGFV